MGSSLDRPLSTKRWAVWLAATVATFAAMEAHAVSTRRQPTLSHALRLWLGIDPLKRHRWVGTLGFASFFGWLIAHVCWGIGPNLKQRGGMPCPRPASRTNAARSRAQPPGTASTVSRAREDRSPERTGAKATCGSANTTGSGSSSTSSRATTSRTTTRGSRSRSGSSHVCIGALSWRSKGNAQQI